MTGATRLTSLPAAENSLMQHGRSHKPSPVGFTSTRPGGGIWSSFIIHVDGSDVLLLILLARDLYVPGMYNPDP